MLKAVTIYMII